MPTLLMSCSERVDNVKRISNVQVCGSVVILPVVVPFASVVRGKRQVVCLERRKEEEVSK